MVVSAILNTKGYAQKLGNELIKVEIPFDCTVNALAQNTVYETIKVPAGTMVLKAGVIVTTAEGAECNFELGDGDAVAGYMAATNDLNSTGLKTSVAGTDAYVGGKYYAAADTIDLIVTESGGADAAKGVVFAIMATVEGK